MKTTTSITPARTIEDIRAILDKARAWTSHPDNEVSKAHRERALALRATKQQ